MRLRTIAVALAIAGSSAIGFAAIPASASGGLPGVNVSCAIGGDTVVSWTHGGHVVSVNLAWYDNSTDTTAVDRMTIQATNGRFSVSVPTPGAVPTGGYVQAIANLSHGLGGETPRELCTG
jgi:hypothetical protein